MTDLPKLRPLQLYEIYRMSGQGMSSEEIRLRLGFDIPTWDLLIKEDPRISESYWSGRACGIDQVSEALLDNARGGDVGSARFYLTHMAEQFRRQPTDIRVRISNGPVTVDVEGIERDFARQRALLEDPEFALDNADDEQD